MTAINPHHVAGLSFTDEQLEERNKHLGASEVPAVLGLDRYKSPHDVWRLKRGFGEPFHGNEHTEWGLRVEPVIRNKAAEVLGVEIDQPGTMVHHGEPWMSATPDGLFLLDGISRVLEIKNKSDRQAVHWGESGTDQVPFDIAAQVYWQLMVTDLQHATVAVLFGKSDFRLYHLTRNEEIATTVLERCRAFWQVNVLEGIEPAIDGSEQTGEYLKKKFAQHSEVLRTATRHEDDLIAQLRDVRARAKAIDEEESVLKNHLMAAIGGDAGLQGRSGRVTWKAPSGKQVSWKSVAEELHAPIEVIEKFSSPMSRRFTPTFPKE